MEKDGEMRLSREEEIRELERKLKEALRCEEYETVARAGSIRHWWKGEDEAVREGEWRPAGLSPAASGLRETGRSTDSPEVCPTMRQS